MNDKAYCMAIKKMNEKQLLDLVLTFPEYTTDPYFEALNFAIEERYEAIKMNRRRG